MGAYVATLFARLQ